MVINFVNNQMFVISSINLLINFILIVCKTRLLELSLIYILMIVKIYDSTTQINVIRIPINGILNQYFFANKA